MSYGIIIFPATDPTFPATAVHAGISMFLTSSLISQLVFTFGGSRFKGAVGSMMIEVMPFLHLMCEIIESKMRGADSRGITATIMVAYASSTILTGIIFLLLGVFRLGNMIQYFPRHILIGCIGGIGLFLIFTGIEVTANIEPIISIGFFKSIIEPRALLLWGVSFLVALVLKGLQTYVTNPMLIPIFYTIVPVTFYAIVFATGVSLDQLRIDGWLFTLPDASEAPFYTFWTYYDFKVVDWSALASTIPTQLALAFFGILHVPINGKHYLSSPGTLHIFRPAS